MKTIVILVLVISLVQLWYCSALSIDADISDRLAKLQFRSLPPEYQQALLEIRATRKTTRDDQSSWCCKNGQPVPMKVITTTYIKWEPTGQTQAVVDGHDNCGFAGWSTCTRYRIEHIPTSHIEMGHEVVPDIENSRCPDNHVVCCKGLMPVASFCMTIAEFKEVVAQWTALQSTQPNALLADLIVTLHNNGLDVGK